MKNDILSKLEFGKNGCWNWTGFKQSGYGVTSKNGKVKKAHRIVYEMLVGPVKKGLCLDHLCRNRSCCNPNHLEQVTLKENILRGEGITAKNARRTHCKNNHPFDKENTFWKKGGGRRCKKCLSDYQRKYYKTHRGAGHGR